MQGMTLATDFSERSDRSPRRAAILVRALIATLDPCSLWMRPPGPGKCHRVTPVGSSRRTVRYQNRTEGEERPTRFRIIRKCGSRKEMECP